MIAASPALALDNAGSLSGVTGGLQNGGSISTPLSGVTGG
jgi:hypothetical protein